MIRKLIQTFIHSACCLMLLIGSAQAQLNLASGWPSGQWYNPARDGEGFYVEVIGEGDNLQIAVAMYSYDADGKQLWLVGNVAIADGDMGATVPVFLIEGPVWGTGYDPADRDTTQFGNIVVQFPSCDSALFSVTSNVAGLESGSYSLVRLTELVGMDCVEPPPPGAPPPGSPSEITPGLWTAEGVCFFVNAEGTKIVESDQCDNGKAFSGNAVGIEVDRDGDVGPDACNVNVPCDGAWDIEPWTDEYTGFTFGRAICVNEVGGIARINFVDARTANVLLYESQGLEGAFCYAPDPDVTGTLVASPQ